MNLRLILGAAAAIAAAPLVVACVATTVDGQPIVGQKQKGQLGLAEFQYPCDSSTLVCALDGNAASYPTTIATGARFKLRARYTGGAGSLPSSALTLEPIAREQISTDPDGSFVALRAGYGGIVLREPAGGDIVDYTLFSIAKPAKMELFKQSSAPGQTWNMEAVASQVQVSGHVTLQAVFRSDLGESLGGEIPIDWKPSNPDAVELKSLARGRVDVIAHQKGTIELVGEGAGLSARVTLNLTDVTPVFDAGTDSGQSDGGDGGAATDAQGGG
jgi:hypothetical protein